MTSAPPFTGGSSGKYTVGGGSGSGSRKQQQQRTMVQMRMEELLRMRQPKRKGRKPTKKERTTYINIEEDQFKDIVHELTGSWEALVRRSQQQQHEHEQEKRQQRQQQQQQQQQHQHQQKQWQQQQQQQQQQQWQQQQQQRQRQQQQQQQQQQQNQQQQQHEQQQQKQKQQQQQQQQKRVEEQKVRSQKSAGSRASTSPGNYRGFVSTSSPVLRPGVQSAISGGQETSGRQTLNQAAQPQATHAEKRDDAAAAADSFFEWRWRAEATMLMPAPSKRQRLSTQDSTAVLSVDVPAAARLPRRASDPRPASDARPGHAAGVVGPASAAPNNQASAARLMPRATAGADLSLLSSSTAMLQQESVFSFLPVSSPDLLTLRNHASVDDGCSRGPADASAASAAAAATAAVAGAVASTTAARQLLASFSASQQPLPSESCSPLVQMVEVSAALPCKQASQGPASTASADYEKQKNVLNSSLQLSALASAQAAKPSSSYVCPAEASGLATPAVLRAPTGYFSGAAMPSERLASLMAPILQGSAAATEAVPPATKISLLYQSSRGSLVPATPPPPTLAPASPPTLQAPTSVLSSADLSALAVATLATGSPVAAQLLSLALQLKEASERNDVREHIGEPKKQHAHLERQAVVERASREGDCCERADATHASNASLRTVQQQASLKGMPAMIKPARLDCVKAERNQNNSEEEDGLDLKLAVMSPETPSVQEHAETAVSLELTLGLRGSH